MPSLVNEVKSSGDESQSDVEGTLIAPVKRKRGRPSKTGKPAAPVQKKPVVARGRGRPPKVKALGRGRPKKFQTIDEPEVVENGSSSAEEMEVADENLKSNVANMPPAKGRGRSKKA